MSSWPSAPPSVALDCGQFQAAERAAARWRSLCPPIRLRCGPRCGPRWVSTRSMTRAAPLRSWIKDGGGLAPVKRQSRHEDTGAALAEPCGRWRRNRACRQPRDAARRAGAAVAERRAQLALADLAFDGWNYREALQYAQRALSAGAGAPRRSCCWRARTPASGEADQAVAAAGAAHTAAPRTRASLVDVLMLLGREREARMALETLRDSAPCAHAGQRRLGCWRSIAAITRRRSTCSPSC
jgi:hypothetical protein